MLRIKDLGGRAVGERVTIWDGTFSRAIEWRLGGGPLDR
jgi:hypothetical protein